MNWFYWLIRWVLRRRQSDWFRGLLCAEAMVGNGDRPQLESLVECARDFGTYTEFDRGIEDYLMFLDGGRK